MLLRLAIDLAHMREGATGGIAIQFRHLLPTLLQQLQEYDVHIFCTKATLPLLPRGTPKVVVHVLPVWAYYPRLEALLARLQPDVLFRRFPFEDRMDFPQSRQVVLIPDLQHEALPNLFSRGDLRRRRQGFSKALRGAAALVTISEFSRSCIESHRDYAGQPIAISPPALPSRLVPEATSPIAPPYFFYPANLWPHKNHARLIRAFQTFNNQNGRAYRLVLTGHRAGWKDLQRVVSCEDVVHLGFVDNITLAALYKSAVALTFVSLYEGFGIPLLESFALGAPVLCSNRGSLPEVGGEAVLLCNPLDEADIARCLQQISIDQDLRARLRRQGHVRLSSYRWEASARALRDILMLVGGREVQPRTPAEVVRGCDPHIAPDIGAPGRRPRTPLPRLIWYAVRPIANALERGRLRVRAKFAKAAGART